MDLNDIHDLLLELELVLQKLRFRELKSLPN